MPKSDQQLTFRQVNGMPGLEQLIDRLVPGMKLEGRVVEVFEKNVIILRVWSYNILTESSYPFQKFDEVILHVQSVLPKLVFALQPTIRRERGAIYA